MLEARLPEAGLLKRVLDSITGLIVDANLICSGEGIRLQAMDNSHVALSSVELRTEGFDPYRCDRAMTIGVSVASLLKIVKSGNNDDILTLRSDDVGDTLSLTFESARTDRLAEYKLKLMDIDADQLGIPDTRYEANVTMSSHEFARVVRDLGNVGESVTIDVQKGGITFSAEGDIGEAKLHLKQGAGAANGRAGSGSGGPRTSPKKVKKQDPEDDEEMKAEEDDEEDVKPAKRARINDDDEEDAEEEEEVVEQPKKKAPAAGKKGKKAGAEGEEAGGEIPVQIELEQAVRMTFSLKFLALMAKAAPLSPVVKLGMTKEFPLSVEFAWESGMVHFFLAPKLGEDEEDE